MRGFTVVSIIAIAIVMLLMQVPQPMRGYLIGWLFIFGTVGVVILRVVRTRADVKKAELELLGASEQGRALLERRRRAYTRATAPQGGRRSALRITETAPDGIHWEEA